ncbi:putative pentatricopeptide repeat-containing protein at1g12700 mitochondrial [Phtheirospermum japonicum]|uniref:Putative pentatricopeptide repeat-containing protein at1g12700 mitochondrial n=1 Tax=Phtheirospermum japonicum TaxID=374723 RepID=A0A830D8E0_9LAMI|nr:putative pentatricopeptide repeat-containing protein at1g12700 mitochondrial [Phtheirospermum japonicum]
MGFFIRQFLTYSPRRYELGESIIFFKSPFPSLSIFRYFGTKSASNCDSREKIKLGLGNIKGLDDAICLHENMSRMRPLPSVIQFTQLLSRVVNLKEYSAAIYLFKDICNLGVPVNEYTMTIAVNCYCLSNRVDYGFSILGWFFKRGCVPNVFTFSTLLKGLFRENKISEAQELFRKMVEEELCELNVVTYVIDGLCKAGNTPMAIELLRVMEKGRGCKPNNHIYSMVIASLSLIRGLCNLSRCRDAKMVLKKMIDHKIYPNVMTFSTLVDALCKGGLLGEAEDVLQIMKQQNVNPNLFTYNSLMDGYCLQGRMDEARSVFDSSMPSMNIAPDVISYSILINGYYKRKKIDEAMHMFREMPTRGLQPDIVTYSIVLQGLFRGGRCSEALEIFDELQAVGLKPNFYTYCNMLDGLCRNDRVDRALLLLDELENKGGEHHLHIAYYSIVMDGLCEAKNLDQARVIFSDLASKGLEPDVATYTIMIRGCCQNGLLDEAQDLFQRMKEASLSPDGISYNVIVRGNLKGGKYEAASKFLEEMDAKGFSPDSLTFELLHDSLDAKEHNSTVFKMFQKWAPASTLNKNQQAKELGV